MRLIILYLLISIPAFSQVLNTENVYVHTDKNLYLPGEIMWFKHYVLDQDTRKPLFENSVVYIELTDREGNAALQTKVENKPSANGSLYIPQNIPTGVYRLKAYTLRMKDQHLFFSKDISVVNPYLARPEAPAQNDFDFQIFPEGGTLLHGVPGKIAHKLINAQGKGEAHSLLITENGKPLGRLSVSNALGMGNFTFTPQVNAVYTVQAEVNGRVVASAAFPEIQTEGTLLNATSESDRYRIQVHSTEKRGLVLQYERPNGQVHRREVQAGPQGSAEIILNKNDLAEGTSCLSLLDSRLQPLNERILFRPPADTLVLRPVLSATALKRRSEATLVIETPRAAQAGFSVAIRPADLSHDDDIFTALFLRKNIPGRIERPDFYLSAQSTEADLESLLLTQGWRKIKESTVTENRYHQIQARFTDRETRQPLSAQNALLSVPGVHTRVFPARTDDNGVATFFVKNIYGATQLALKLSSNMPSHVEIVSPYTAHPKTEYGGLPEVSPEKLSARAIHTQIENSYFGKERAVFSTSALADSIPFYGEPDSRYFLDDYTRFVLMEEVLREYVKEIRVRKSRDQYELRMLDHSQNVLFKESPLILFDGIPLSDANEILRYDPLKVKRIDLIKDAFLYGEVHYEGLISFHTYGGVLENFKLDAATTLLNYDGVQYERVFYTPKYGTEEEKKSRKADTRTLLYWNPNAAPHETLKFSTSDIPGRYLIDIQGIDETGKPGRALSYLTVD